MPHKDFWDYIKKLLSYHCASFWATLFSTRPGPTINEHGVSLFKFGVKISDPLNFFENHIILLSA